MSGYTGPFPDPLNGTSDSVFFSKFRYRSNSRPYREVLPYSVAAFVSDKPDRHFVVRSSANLYGYDESAYSVAFDRFSGKTGERVQMLLNAWEGRQTFVMMVSLLKKLTSAMKHVRKGNVYGAFRALSIDPSRPEYKRLTKKGVSKTLANNWLEYTFGWVPVISDLFGLMSVAEHDFHRHLVYSSAKHESRFSQSYGSGERFNSVLSGRVSLAGYVRVSNPNLFLANQLGLINPVAVAWDAVPLSFVLDWFGKVNKWLNSFTIFAGLSFERCQLRVKNQVHSAMTHLVGSPSTGRGLAFTRDHWGMNVPPLKSRVRMPVPGLWHAATLSSLSVQILGTLNPFTAAKKFAR